MGKKAKAVYGDAMVKAIKQGDQKAIDATLAEIDRERDAKIAAYQAAHPPRKIPAGLIGVTESDMEKPQYKSGLELRKMRGHLELGQVVVAEAMGVSQARISQIESDDFIPEEMRWKLWNYIWTEVEAKIARDNAANVGKSFDGSKSIEKSLNEILSEMGLFQSADETIKARITLLEQKLKLAEDSLAYYKNLSEIGLLDRCILLEKELQKALEANAEYVKLFSLKGQSVAADELQDALAEKVRKEKP